jgi:hypothetical protein
MPIKTLKNGAIDCFIGDNVDPVQEVMSDDIIQSGSESIPIPQFSRMSKTNEGESSTVNQKYQSQFTNIHPSRKAKSIECPAQCGVMCTTSFNARRHFEYFCKKNPERKDFVCSKCSMPLVSMGVFKIHSKTCMKTKTCGCGAIYKKRRHYKYHMKKCALVPKDESVSEMSDNSFSHFKDSYSKRK